MNIASVINPLVYALMTDILSLLLPKTITLRLGPEDVVDIAPEADEFPLDSILNTGRTSNCITRESVMLVDSRLPS